MAGNLLAAVALIAGVVAGGLTPHLSPAAPSAAVCAQDVAACDIDGDGIGDLVEEAICGSATCATGDEDADGDGVPDAEQLAETLEQGGPGGVVRPADPGWVRLVFPGPVVVEFPWWPFAVGAVAVVGVVVAVVARRRVRSGVDPAAGAGRSSAGG